MTRWYAIRCLTGHEARVASALDCETFAPTYTTQMRPARKRKPVTVEHPLLPGYVLARVPDGLWQRVRGTKGVVGWVSGGDGSPLPVPALREAEIARLATRCQLGAFNHDGVGAVKPGDLLEVLFGPFAGWSVTFLGVRGRQIEGEVEWLGAKRPVRLSVDDVRLRK